MPLSDTQLVTFNEKTVFGPPMPMPLSHHCLVRINSSLVIIAGGNTDNGIKSKSTILYDIVQSKWFFGPELSLPRTRHACGNLRTSDANDESSEELIVVTGGDTEISDTNTEILLVPRNHQNGTWQPGPYLPYELDDASMVQTSNQLSLIIIGGIRRSGYRSKTLMKLDCPLSIEACKCQEMEQVLSKAR